MILIIVLALFPLALYCFILAAVNRRQHPVIVSGPWDFLGTVLGASGFLLFAGPYILNNLNERWREQWLLAAADPTADLGDAGHQLWWWIRAGYFVLIVGGIACLLYRRRNTWSVYNVQPDTVPEVLGQVLDSLGMRWLKRGETFQLLDRPATVAPKRNGDQAPLLHLNEPASASGHRSHEAAMLMPATAAQPARAMAFLEVDRCRSLHHVSIRWAAKADPRQTAVEEELRRALAEVNTRDNPAAGWFMSFAGALFVILILLLGFWIGVMLWAGPRVM